MRRPRNISPVEAAVSGANVQLSRSIRLREASSWHARLARQRVRFRGEAGFTLAELLISVGVMVLLILLVTQLLNTAATVTTLGHKKMDADSQARQLLDRMAIDFTQMVKRSDVDFFAKGTTAPNSAGGPMTGNDKIAFYSAVPGYYPSTGLPSPFSLVAYRINSLTGTAAFNKLERLGKGLVWNGVSTTDTPVVFLPVTISAMWPYATNANADPSSPSAYETIGSQVFRFEYYYLLKGQTVGVTTYTSIVSNTPWDTRIAIGTCCATAPGSPCCHNGVSGMQDVAAVIANIAVVDSKSKVLLTDAQITTLASGLADYSGQAPGVLRANWQTYLDGITTLPRAAISGIRVYERYLYLSPPTLLTAPSS